jgi:hypothetical protein
MKGRITMRITKFGRLALLGSTSLFASTVALAQEPPAPPTVAPATDEGETATAGDAEIVVVGTRIEGA